MDAAAINTGSADTTTANATNCHAAYMPGWRPPPGCGRTIRNLPSPLWKYYHIVMPCAASRLVGYNIEPPLLAAGCWTATLPPGDVTPRAYPTSPHRTRDLNTWCGRSSQWLAGMQFSLRTPSYTMPGTRPGRLPRLRFYILITCRQTTIAATSSPDGHHFGV